MEQSNYLGALQKPIVSGFNASSAASEVITAITFQRDLKKTFNTTPQRWLTQKRLELAHYEFVEKQKKPIDVCYEVGFENLSHFSFVFKKQFGLCAD